MGGTGVDERLIVRTMVILMLPFHPMKLIRVEELLKLCAVSLLFLTTSG